MHPTPTTRTAREIDRIIVDAARPTADVVQRRTLLHLGVGDGSIRNRIATGFLQVVHPGIYAIGSAPLSARARLVAALFAGGPTSALSHLTAANLWEISRFEPRHIDLLIPHRHDALVGVTTRYTRDLPKSHVTVRDDMRRTTVSRTVLDLAEVLTPWQLTNVMSVARRRNRLRIDTIEHFSRRYTGRHGTGCLRKAIQMHRDGCAGTKSPLEDDGLDIVLGSPLPEPVVNKVFRFGIQGWELDLAWPDRRINVELDGRWGHAEPNRAALDAVRDECLAAAGWIVVRIDSDTIWHRPDRMLDQIRAVWREPVI